MVSNSGYWGTVLVIATIAGACALYLNFGFIISGTVWTLIFLFCMCIIGDIFPYTCPSCQHRLGKSALISEFVDRKKTESPHFKKTYTGTSYTERRDGKIVKTDRYRNKGYIDTEIIDTHLSTIVCNNCGKKFTKKRLSTSHETEFL